MGDDGGKKDDFGDAFDAKAFEALERDFQEVRAGKTLSGDASSGVCRDNQSRHAGLKPWVERVHILRWRSALAGIGFNTKGAWPPHFWHLTHGDAHASCWHARLQDPGFRYSADVQQTGFCSCFPFTGCSKPL